MDLIKKETLIKADGSSHEAESALVGKDLILVYFSGHWCPPCRRFTPMLKDFYEVCTFHLSILICFKKKCYIHNFLTLQKVSKEGVEVIFASSDNTPEDMTSYMKESHGDWLALKHGSDTQKELEKKFNVCGIPTLAVMKVSQNICGDLSHGRL